MFSCCLHSWTSCSPVGVGWHGSIGKAPKQCHISRPVSGEGAAR